MTIKFVYVTLLISIFQLAYCLPFPGHSGSSNGGKYGIASDKDPIVKGNLYHIKDTVGNKYGIPVKDVRVKNDPTLVIGKKNEVQYIGSGNYYTPAGGREKYHFDTTYDKKTGTMSHNYRFPSNNLSL